MPISLERWLFSGSLSWEKLIYLFFQSNRFMLMFYDVLLLVLNSWYKRSLQWGSYSCQGEMLPWHYTAYWIYSSPNLAILGEIGEPTKREFIQYFWNNVEKFPVRYKCFNLNNKNITELKRFSLMSLPYTIFLNLIM